MVSQTQQLSRGDAMQAFWYIFHLDIRKYYSNRLLGFDIVKFDEEIVKPNDGESTSQAIERQWGKDAITVIEALL